MRGLLHRADIWNRWKDLLCYSQTYPATVKCSTAQMVLGFIAAYNNRRISWSHDKLKVQNRSWNHSMCRTKVMSECCLSDWCCNVALFILNKPHCWILAEISTFCCSSQDSGLSYMMLRDKIMQVHWHRRRCLFVSSKLFWGFFFWPCPMFESFFSNAEQMNIRWVLFWVAAACQMRPIETLFGKPLTKF